MSQLDEDLATLDLFDPFFMGPEDEDEDVFIPWDEEDGDELEI